MALHVMILLEITLAVFVQLLVASPVSLQKRGMSHRAGGALHDFNRTNFLHQQSTRLSSQTYNFSPNLGLQPIVQRITTILLVASK